MYANFIYNSGLISFSKPLQLLLLVCCWELESDLMFETRCNQDNLMHKFPYSFLTREQRLINGNGSNVFPNVWSVAVSFPFIQIDRLSIFFLYLEYKRTGLIFSGEVRDNIRYLRFLLIIINDDTFIVGGCIMSIESGPS